MIVLESSIIIVIIIIVVIATVAFFPQNGPLFGNLVIEMR